MNRGVNRQQIFFCDTDRVEFGRLLGEIHRRFGIEVGAYCLLDNHYHVVLHCPDGGLSEAMQLLASVFTRHTNDRVGRDGPIFRGRFHSIPIVDDRQLLVTVRYVHRNALDVAGVERVDDYRWSSHRALLGHRQRADFLCVDRVLEIFGGTASEFAAFVDDEHAGPTFLPPQSSLQPLLAMVTDEVFGLDAPGPKFGRTLQLLLADRLDAVSGVRLIDALSFSNDDARDRAHRRALQRARCDPRIGETVNRAIDLLGGQSVSDTD